MLQQLNQNNFDEAIAKEELVLVDFYADWCGPCQAMQPALEQISAQYAGKATVVKVNVDDNPELAMNYGIRGIPTLFYFKHGQLAQQQLGLQTANQIAAQLNAMLA